MSLDRKEILRNEVDYLLELGIVVPSMSPRNSPTLLDPKENVQSRLSVDFRKVQCSAIKDSFPLPRIVDIIDAVGQACYVTIVDLLKGYYQVDKTERAQSVSAFNTLSIWVSNTVMESVVHSGT